MGFSAYRRPDFGFDESLAFARRLVGLAGTVDTKLGLFTAQRDAALAAWSGPWGEEFRLRATDEDTNTTTAGSACRFEADQWAKAWKDAATETNGVVYAEAVAELKAHLKDEREEYERNRSGWQAFGDTLYAGTVGLFTGGAEEAFKDVPEPHAAALPLPDGYASPASFVWYDRSGEEMVPSYHGTPPGSSSYGMSDAEYEDWVSGQTEEGEDPAPPPPAVTADVPDRPAPRGADGHCSMNLDLVDAYLNAGGDALRQLGAEIQAVGTERGTAVTACQNYRFPTEVAVSAAGLLLQGVTINYNGVAAVRVAVGVDRHGVVDVPNSLITQALDMSGTARAPGLISFEERELLGVAVTSGFLDDPVNAANGNFVHSERDLSFPGFADELSIVRVHNSLTDPDDGGLFGPRWSSRLDQRLEVDGDLPGAVWWHDGARIPLHPTPAPAPGGTTATTVPTAPTPGGTTATAVPATPPGEGGTTVDGTGAGLVTTDAVFVNLRRRFSVRAVPDGWRLSEGHDAWVSFSPEGAVTGWGLGPAAVTVTPVDGGLVLREACSGRSLRLEVVDGLVRSAVDGIGRTVTYRYLDGHCVEVERPSGGVRYGVAGGMIHSIHDADGVLVCENTYDERGRVMTQRSPHGRVVSFEYLDGGLTRTSDAQGGPVNVMTHDRRGNLTAMIGGDGRAMRMRWDRTDRMVALTDRDGRVTTYSHHPDPERDLLVAIVGPDGSVERREYDDLDRLVAEITPAGRVTRYRYGGAGRMPSRMIDPTGAVTRFERDRRGLLTRVIDPDGVATSYEWNADGLVAAVVDGEGGRTELRYDDAGELTGVRGPSGAEASFTVDAGGRVLRTVDPAGVVRHHGWSPAGRALSCTSAAGGSWQARWGADGEVAAVSDPAGAEVAIGWDPFGRQRSITLPDGQELHFDHDKVGNLVSATDGAGATTTQGFDGVGNVIATTDADGFTWSRTVDHRGRTLEATAPDGAVTRFEHDRDGHLGAVTAPDGAVTRFDLDDAGRVVAAVAPDGGRTTYAYSRAGRLLSRRSPAGRTWTYRHDRAGRLAAVVDPDGTTRTFGRDAAGTVTTVGTGDDVVELQIGSDGRLVGWSAPAAGDSGRVDWAPGRVTVAPTGSAPTVFELDERAEVARTIDPAGVVTTLDRDLAGRITAATTGPQTVSVGYDRQGRIATVSDGSGTTATIESSPAGRVLAVTTARPDPAAARLDPGPDPALDADSAPDPATGSPDSAPDPALDADSDRVETGGGGATRIEVELDPAGRVRGLRGGSGERLLRLERDRRGRITAAVNRAGTVRVDYDRCGSVTATTGLGGVVTTYERDADGLVSAVDSGGTLVGYRRSARGDITGFTVDGGRTIDAPTRRPDDGTRDGGRLVADVHGRTHRYDRAGRLVETVTAAGQRRTFAYDELSLLAADHTPEHGQRRFTYNRAGQLVTTTTAAGTTTYRYDHAGRRVSEEGPDGRRVRYHWNELSQLTAVERSGGAGTSITPITYSGLGRPERIGDTTIGWDDGVSGAPVRVGGTLHLRSGMSVLPLGVPGATWDDGTRDDPWGLTATTGPHLGHRGELCLDDLVLLDARVYDSATRQFLTVDPAPLRPGQPASHNRYAYTWCDPVNQVDPSGLQPVSVADFEEWRANQERSRWQSFTHAVAEDPWGAVMLAGVIIVGAVLIAVATVLTGGLALVVLAGGVGMVLGAGISAGYGIATKSFDPRVSAATGLVTGIAAAATVALAPAGATGWGAVAGWGLAGAAGGALGGAGTSLTNQVIGAGVPLSEVDWGKVGTDTLVGAAVGGVTGGFGRYVTTALAPGVATGGQSAFRSVVLSHADELAGGLIEWGVEGAFTGNFSPDSLAVNVASEFAGGRLGSVVPPPRGINRSGGGFGPLDETRAYNWRWGGITDTNFVQPTRAEQGALELAVPRDASGNFVVHPDPFASSWVSHVNGGGPTVPGRGTNCNDCSLATLSTWYGDPQVSAGIRSPLGESLIRGNNWSGAPAVIEGAGGPGLAHLESELLRSGNGSAASVSVKFGSRPDTGHSLNAVVQNNQVVWIDSQVPQVQTGAPPMMNVADVGEVSARIFDPSGQPVALRWAPPAYPPPPPAAPAPPTTTP